MDIEHIRRPNSWKWGECNVDPSEDHLELRYGSARDTDWMNCVLVALVGRPVEGSFAVQFMIDRDAPASKAMMDYVIAELDFYLMAHGERDPWVYAKYHCGMSSNVYSNVHWSFHPGELK